MGSNKPPKPWKIGDPEPPGCRRAFEDYWAMGEGRSLDRLAETYRNGDQWGPNKPPCTKRTTLGEWSRRYHWQDRISLRERDLADEEWKRQKGEIVAHRVKHVRAVRAAIGEYETAPELLALQRSVADYERLLKMEALLLGEPLLPEGDTITSITVNLPSSVLGPADKLVGSGDH
jgi:hypothetical protein